MSSRFRLRTLITIAGLLMTASVGRSQNMVGLPAAAEPQKSASTSRKIWTEDDLLSLRTPADNYLAQKEAEAAAAALAKLRAAADPAHPSSLKIRQANSVEEAERAIKDTLEDIQDQKATLARLNKEVDESPKEERAEKIKDIERRAGILEESQAELKALQARRDDLAGKVTSGNSASVVISEPAVPFARP